MKPENKQRFSIRKYAIGAASVLIGFAFQAQAVEADGVVPVTTEDQPTVQTTGESAPQTSEEKLETAPSTENVTPVTPVAPVTNTEAPKVEATPSPAVEDPAKNEVAPEKSEVTEEVKKAESEKEKVENKEVAKVEAPSAKENKLPETGNQESEWLIATGLMTALTAYGLCKKKD